LGIPIALIFFAVSRLRTALLTLCALSGAASAAAPAVEGEILVKLAGSVSWHDAQLFLARTGGTVVGHGAGTDYYRVYYPKGSVALAAATALSTSPRVYEAVPNRICNASGIGTSPTAPLQQYQWNLPAMRVDPFEPAARADGVTVAVLDTGVAYESYQDDRGTYEVAPDLAAVEFVPGYDFINGDAHANDDQRHGTHVASVIAATSGTTPMVRGVTLMPIKVLDAHSAGTELALAEGIIFAADNGADVINMSLAFPPGYFPSRMLSQAVDHAARKGVIMVAAAGNDAAGVVAYPAGFRDVIAVGASSLSSRFRARPGWGGVFEALIPAPYQNHGFKLDVLAPGGRIDGDANGDGFPEAILGQTFRPGQPTNFGYAFYAGTSQAAAEATGVVAAMKGADPTLDAFRARAYLTETAGQLGGFLSDNSGRGRLRASAALVAAAHPGRTDRTRVFANPIVTLHERGGRRTARALVEVLDDSGRPMRLAFVFGTFTGGAYATQVAFTGFDGVARFESPALTGQVVAFQVDAVAGIDRGLVFDRPQGFIRIDAVSLAMLSDFGAGIGTSPTGAGSGRTAAQAGDAGQADGIGTSPTEPTPATGDEANGIGTSPTEPAPPTGDEADGIGTSPTEPAPPTTDDSDGIGTSPTLPTPIASNGIGTSPTLATPTNAPLSLAFDPALFAGTGYRRTLLLPNFSWALAIVPMAVAVDEEWFLATFPGAAARRVVSHGRGVAGSPFHFDPSSFPTAVAVPDGDRFPLVVLTYTSGIGTSPTGIGTSPTGIGTSPTGIVVDGFAPGMDRAAANAMTETLSGWYLADAGLGPPPVPGPRVGPQVFGQLHRLYLGYTGFARKDTAQSVTAYGTALTAAGMSLASSGQGRGAGELQTP